MSNFSNLSLISLIYLEDNCLFLSYLWIAALFIGFSVILTGIFSSRVGWLTILSIFAPKVEALLWTASYFLVLTGLPYCWSLNETLGKCGAGTFSFSWFVMKQELFSLPLGFLISMRLMLNNFLSSPFCLVYGWMNGKFCLLKVNEV